ncbi:hypothetical protein AKJ16_DCAP08887 [Drosera capensis]
MQTRKIVEPSCLKTLPQKASEIATLHDANVALKSYQEIRERPRAQLRQELTAKGYTRDEIRQIKVNLIELQTKLPQTTTATRSLTIRPTTEEATITAIIPISNIGMDFSIIVKESPSTATEGLVEVDLLHDHLHCHLLVDVLLDHVERERVSAAVVYTTIVVCLAFCRVCTSKGFRGWAAGFFVSPEDMKQLARHSAFVALLVCTVAFLSPIISSRTSLELVVCIEQQSVLSFSPNHLQIPIFSGPEGFWHHWDIWSIQDNILYPLINGVEMCKHSQLPVVELVERASSGFSTSASGGLHEPYSSAPSLQLST